MLKVPMHKIQMDYKEFTNKEGHWFDKETMSFFKCKLPSMGILHGNHYYFVSSEQGPTVESSRRYTVRTMDLNGKMSTIGEFQEYETLGKANTALKQYINSL